MFQNTNPFAIVFFCIVGIVAGVLGMVYRTITWLPRKVIGLFRR